MIKNIIFDMDGTLTDTAKVTVRGCQDAAVMFELPPLDAEIIKMCIGWANPEFYHRLYPNVDKELLAAYAVEVEKIERRLMYELKTDLLFEGTKSLLEALTIKGYNLYIASTGDTEHVHTALTCGDIFTFFKEIHCHDANKEKLLRQILHNGSEEAYIMVGDKNKDALAARACGIFSTGVAYGYGSSEEKALFDRLIAHPMELLDILDNRL